MCLPCGLGLADTLPVLSRFGAASMALNLIPGLSIIFAFSTTVGAALWASDLEKKAGGSVDPTTNVDASNEVTDVGKREL